MPGQAIQIIPPHIRTDKSISDNSWMDTVERFVFNIVPRGPFANDAAAATAGIPIGGLYYDTSGIVHIRLV
jgi:hypothetical protein